MSNSQYQYWSRKATAQYWYWVFAQKKKHANINIGFLDNHTNIDIEMWTFFFEYSISILRSLFKNGRFIFAMPISILRWVLKNRHSHPCLGKYWYWHTWSNSILILSFLLKTNNMPISILGFKWPIAIFFYNANIDIEVGLEKHTHKPLPEEILILACWYDPNINIEI